MRKLWIVALALGCAGDDAPPGEVETPCGGAGAPVLEVGSGGASGFVPYADGEALDIQLQGTQYGVFFDLRTSGLDTTAPMSALVRYSLGDETETEDLIANLTLQCGDDETGWTQVFAALPDEHQEESAAMALDGTPLHLSANLTDQANETGSQQLELILAY